MDFEGENGEDIGCGGTWLGVRVIGIILCGNMESGTFHITTGFDWVVGVCFLCMEIWKTGFPTLPHGKESFFLLSFSRHAEEKKAYKKEKRRLRIWLKGL